MSGLVVWSLLMEQSVLYEHAWFTQGVDQLRSLQPRLSLTEILKSRFSWFVSSQVQPCLIPG